MSKMVSHRKFICTDSEYGSCGHNKFWECIIYDDGTLETKYGRVGDPGASTTKNFGSEDRALCEAEKLIRKKGRGKAKKDGSGGRDSQYKEVEIVGSVTPGNSYRTLGKTAWTKIANGDSNVELLISILDQENVHNITSQTTLTYDEDTGLFSTPLGVVGQSSIDEARNLLAKMRPFVEKRKFTNKKGDKLAEDFMMLIPQNVGRRRPNLKTLCFDIKKLKDHNSILDSLQASLDIMLTPKDDDPEVEIPDFGVVVSLLDGGEEFERVDKFYMDSKGRHECTHLKIDSIFKIENQKMNNEWNCIGKDVKPIKEMFHGSRVGNILSILAKGFYIPSSSASHCTGRMFSNGVYFSDCSTKSLQYSYGTWGNRKRDCQCFIFICDVAMGKTHHPYSYGLSQFPQGYDSISALSKNTGLRYNEFVIQQINQINLKYLLHFTS